MSVIVCHSIEGHWISSGHMMELSNRRKLIETSFFRTPLCYVIGKYIALYKMHVTLCLRWQKQLKQVHFSLLTRVCIFTCDVVCWVVRLYVLSVTLAEYKWIFFALLWIFSCLSLYSSPVCVRPLSRATVTFPAARSKIRLAAAPNFSGGGICGIWCQFISVHV